MGFYDTYYRAVVERIVRLTPSMVRIRFRGGDLARWTSSGAPDERLCIVFPTPGQRDAPCPVRMPDGSEDYPDEATRPEMRSYTVRAFDPSRAELVIDVVNHEGGVAARWARQVTPGDTVYVTEAAGWYEPPAGVAWQLLVADLTALPALGRIVEQLPAGTRAHVIAEVTEADDRQEFVSPARVDYQWLIGSGNGVGPSWLPEAVQTFAWPAGPGYVWFAGEAAASRAVRKHLRRELSWPTDRSTILGYWRRGQEEWTARYDVIAPAIESVYTEAVAAGRTSEDALDLYDDALERAGL